MVAVANRQPGERRAGGARVRDELGRIDVLFNTAGVNDPDDGSA